MDLLWAPGDEPPTLLFFHIFLSAQTFCSSCGVMLSPVRMVEMKVMYCMAWQEAVGRWNRTGLCSMLEGEGMAGISRWTGLSIESFVGYQLRHATVSCVVRKHVTGWSQKGKNGLSLLQTNGDVLQCLQLYWLTAFSLAICNQAKQHTVYVKAEDSSWSWKREAEKDRGSCLGSQNLFC